MKGHSVCARSIMKKDLTEIVFILDRSGSFSCRNVSVGRKCGILNSTNRNLRKRRMEDKKILLGNINKIHTTELGVDRIKRNLKIDIVDVVEYCKNKVLDENCHIYKQGKNWYCEIENVKITINSYSYTIITAHIIK